MESLAPGVLLRDIGRGTCGSVFEIPGTAQAIKKGANADALWNDFLLTNRAYDSYLTWKRLLAAYFPQRRLPRVPSAQRFNGPEARDFWAANLSRFPHADQTIAAAFHLDQILPVPELTRKALVRLFFQEDEQVQNDVLNDPPNKDCLVRLYFGQNNPNSSLYGPGDTLRNFPLYLDQARTIGLDVDAYAEEMAIGLATLHWDAQVDAQDTEFVIGSSTAKPFRSDNPDPGSNKRPVSSMDNFTQRETQLWMLDFDKCSEVDLDSKDPMSDVVNKYLVAVTGNDPYFPHPRLDPDLWRHFRKAYLKASDFIIRTRPRLKRHVSKLPTMLIEQWEQWGDRDVEAEDFDPFERVSGDEEVESESEVDDTDAEDDDSEEDEDEDSQESSEGE
ncbi:uncharacterized protein Z520_07135 [Fonsecaea multimorphosa CBS 102226]|uniref:DUF3669 domain-containing protein n=1 Tax=Fonsecaea multimorphosa CBS 102226 TaxID=1442371 RepID=A0A0D2IJ12_9EURO|nr:uncharacterized protein Z520_07135 [Fonsecaea multimorphosa CBS 102226]KIX97021.1 hypothetical protein Z520_07135 [Fonsecaea multimorphosa CBS 102226]OAL22800.1 hypothetical protein AYO22_06708 [Fonsecaea multimorphosa]